MQRLKIKSARKFLSAINSGICCVAQDGARHVINEAYIGETDDGETCFMVDTIQGLLSFERFIMLFVFDSAREAQQFLNFEDCELDEDKILDADVIE